MAIVDAPRDAALLEGHPALAVAFPPGVPSVEQSDQIALTRRMVRIHEPARISGNLVMPPRLPPAPDERLDPDWSSPPALEWPAERPQGLVMATRLYEEQLRGPSAEGIRRPRFQLQSVGGLAPQAW